MTHRTVTIGNGRLFVVLDDCGRATDLYHPHAGFPNHLTDVECCRIGLQVSGHVETLWVDPNWVESQSIDDDGLGARTHLRVPNTGLSLIIEDRLSTTSTTWQRTFNLTCTTGEHAVRLLLHHDLRLGGTDIGGCVRHHPSTHILHFNRSQYCQLSFVDNPIDDWTLGRADESNGSGICGSCDASSLGRNPVAMGATESLIARSLDISAARSSSIVLRLDFGETEAAAQEAATCVVGTASQENPKRGISSKRTQPTIDELASKSIGVLLAHVDWAGGIVAGLDGHQTQGSRDGYGYVWMRDAALIADVLGRSGRDDIVGKLLDFATRVSEAGGWIGQRHHTDGSPGSTWHRQFPKGSPLLPIQTDETALTVWLATRHMSRTSAQEGAAVFDRIVCPMTEFLVRHCDPETDLPLPSHDLWEERFGIHTFTAVATAVALRGAAKEANGIGNSGLSEKWAEASFSMFAAIKNRLFHRDAGRFARTATVFQPDQGLHLDTTPDASLLLAAILLNDDERNDPLWMSTTRSVIELIGVEQIEGGMARYPGDAYARKPELSGKIPGNAWPIATAWAAELHALQGDQREAARLLESICTMTTSAGTLPEQLDPASGLPASITPLPWSHAAFLSAVIAARARN